MAETLQKHLMNIITQLEAINTNTDGLELKADTINLNTDQLESKLDTLNSKDFATQTTLALIKTGTDKIPASPSTLAGQQDALSHYKISNVDADASPNYYGYEDKDGNWYIMKETISAGNDIYLYVKGTGGLASVWASRATESYASFNATF